MISFVKKLAEKEFVISRSEARKLFRIKEFKKLIQILESGDKDSYLESLLVRAKNELENPSVKKIEPVLLLQTLPSISMIKKVQTFFYNKKVASQQRRQAPVSSIAVNEVRNSQQENKADINENIKVQSSKQISNSAQWIYKKKQERAVRTSSEMLKETLEQKEALKQKIETGATKEEIQVAQQTLEEREWKLAQNVQNNLIPTIDSHILEGIDTAVKTLSCSELSGDVYDFITTNKDEVVFYLGDVTGHGTAAGLVMSMINCLTHSILQRTTKLTEVLSTLNKEIKPKLSANMFTSMVMCHWHAPLRKLTFSGAGHEYILHYHAQTQEVEKIKVGGIAIGMLADMSKLLKEHEIILENEDILLLYTDGIEEAWDESKKNLYGLDKVISDLKFFAKYDSAQQILDDIFQNVRTFQGKSERTDDISLMIFRRIKTVDEIKIKNDYLKTQLKNDIIENEVVLGENTEGLSPNSHKNQDALVKKSMELASIYMEEGQYNLALVELQRARRIAPNSGTLETLFHTVTRKIELQTMAEQGVFRFFKEKIMFSLFSLFKSRKSSKQQFLENLENNIVHCIQFQRLDELHNSLGKLQAIDPNNKLIKRSQNFLSQRSSMNTLNTLFDTNNIVTVKNETTADTVLNFANDTASERSQVLDFKKSLEKVEQQVEAIAKKTQAVNAAYNPNDLFAETDILGLKKLLKLKAKNLDEVVVESKETQRLTDVAMKWDKDHVMNRSKKSYNSFMATISPMTQSDLYEFIEKLSAFVQAEIPIQRAIEIIYEQAKNDGFIYILDEITKDLDMGKLLSQSMKRFPKAFPEMLIYLVHAGEKSGALPAILNDLAQQMRDQHIVKSRIKSALIYPAVIVFASFSMIIGMMVGIVPKLVKVYMETGVDLPRITQVIVSISNFIGQHYVLLAVYILLFFIALIAFGKTVMGKKVYHKLYLHLPVVSLISRQNNVMLFVSNLAILLQNGIQIGEALQITARITPNVYYKKEILLIREKMIVEGIPLSEAMGINKSFLQRTKLLPLEVLQSVNAGEQTGRLAHMLNALGEMYKEKIKNSVKSLSEIIEPLLMVFVGLMVGVILLAIMFPLFQLGKVLRKQ